MAKQGAENPVSAEVAGAAVGINSYRGEHRWPNGRQMTRSEVVDRLYGEPPAESSSRTHETMAQTRMRLMPGRPISGPVEGPNW